MDDHVCFAFRAPAVKLPSNGEASMGTSAAIPSRRRVQGTFSSASKQLHAQCNAMLIRPGLLQYRYQRPPPYPRQLATICHVHEFHLSRDSEVRKREKNKMGDPAETPSSIFRPVNIPRGQRSHRKRSHQWTRRARSTHAANKPYTKHILHPVPKTLALVSPLT